MPSIGLSILVLTLLGAGCARNASPGPKPSAKTSANASVKASAKASAPKTLSPAEFHQLRSLQLKWKTESGLELASGVTFNIHNGALFFPDHRTIEQLSLHSSAECATNPADCGVAVEVQWSAKGSAAWLQASNSPDENSLDLCIWQAALHDCVAEHPGAIDCYAVHDVDAQYPPAPIVHSAATLADPLFQALGKTQVVYLRDRGLTSEGGDDACYAWEVDTSKSADLVFLERWDQEEEKRVRAGRTIRVHETYTWTWGKSYTSGVAIDDKGDQAPPIVTEEREGCPETIPDNAEEVQWGTIGVASYCLVPLGKFVRADARVIELAETSLYKTASACEQSRHEKIAARIPRCSGR